MKDHKKNWRQKAREYLAESFGGKCVICGYDKSTVGFDYHHINPEEKDSQLSLGMKNGFSWEKIVEEARKCTLVCCRCHRELHAGLVDLPDDCARFNEEYVDVIKLKEKKFDACPQCGEEKNKRRKFCSIECSNASLRVFEVGKDELQSLIQNFSYEEIGRRFGVSGNAIKKRCRLFGIKLTPRKMRL